MKTEKKYPINSYFRIPLEELKDYFSPEFKAHLCVIFQVSDLSGVKLQFGSHDEIEFHYKGEK